MYNENEADGVQGGSLEKQDNLSLDDLLQKAINTTMTATSNVPVAGVEDDDFFQLQVNDIPRLKYSTAKAGNVAYNLENDFFFKTIRHDEQDFWAKFIDGFVWGNEDGAALRREGARKAYTSRLSQPEAPYHLDLKRQYEVVDTATHNNAPLFENEKRKLILTKAQSLSLASPNQGYYPRPFGTNSRDCLVGVRCAIVDAYVSRIMVYDGGTFGRPYDADTPEQAKAYVDDKLKRKIYVTNLPSLVKEGLRNPNKHNEVMARLHANPNDSSLQIVIFNDNIESRLLAQARAFDLAYNLSLRLDRPIPPVPVSFYSKDKSVLEKHLTHRNKNVLEYYLPSQFKDDLREATKQSAYRSYIAFFKHADTNFQNLNNPKEFLEILPLLRTLGKATQGFVFESFLHNSKGNVNSFLIDACKTHLEDTFLLLNDNFKFQPTIEILLNNFNDYINVSNVNQLANLLHRLINKKNPQLVENLLDKIVATQNDSLLEKILCYKKDGKTLIGLATERGYWSCVDKIIKTGYPNANDKADYSHALFYTAKHIDQNQLSLDLLNNHAKPNVSAQNGFSAVHHAIKSNNNELLEAMLKADASYANHIFRHGTIRPIDYAVKIENIKAIELLLLHGANYNKPDPMALAVQHGLVNVIDHLITSGGAKYDLNRTYANGETYTHIAARYNQPQVIEYLNTRMINHANIADRSGNTPVHIAVEQASKEALEVLARTGANLNYLNIKSHKTPIYLAIENNDLSTLETLHKLGADFNMTFQSDEGVEELSYAHIAVSLDKPEILTKLSQLGININTVDSQDFNPIGLAICLGKVDVFKALYPIINSVGNDNYQQNNWQYAAYAVENGQISILEALNDFGINFNEVSETGDTLAHFAVENGNVEMCNILNKMGIDFNQPDINGNTPAHIAMEKNDSKLIDFLIRNGCEFNQENQLGETPIHKVINGKNYTLFDHLMRQNKIDSTQVNMDGKTLAHIAVESDSTTVLSKLQQIKHGFNFNQTDKNGQTPLHLAIESGSDKLINYIMSLKGINESLTIRDNQGKTPIDIAREKLDGSEKNKTYTQFLKKCDAQHCSDPSSPFYSTADDKNQPGAECTA